MSSAADQYEARRRFSPATQTHSPGLSLHSGLLSLKLDRIPPVEPGRTLDDEHSSEGEKKKRTFNGIKTRGVEVDTSHRAVEKFHMDSKGRCR